MQRTRSVDPEALRLAAFGKEWVPFLRGGRAYPAAKVRVVLRCCPKVFLASLAVCRQRDWGKRASGRATGTRDSTTGWWRECERAYSIPIAPSCEVKDWRGWFSVSFHINEGTV